MLAFISVYLCVDVIIYIILADAVIILEIFDVIEKSYIINKKMYQINNGIPIKKVIISIKLRAFLCAIKIDLLVDYQKKY